MRGTENACHHSYWVKTIVESWEILMGEKSQYLPLESGPGLHCAQPRLLGIASKARVMDPLTETPTDSSLPDCRPLPLCASAFISPACLSPLSHIVICPLGSTEHGRFADSYFMADLPVPLVWGQCLPGRAGIAFPCATVEKQPVQLAALVPAPGV